MSGIWLILSVIMLRETTTPRFTNKGEPDSAIIFLIFNLMTLKVFVASRFARTFERLKNFGLKRKYP